jgi:gamma-glutamylcyclotransferase (GGCT)/AIG2-like uncharacterized protein YtfP
MTGGVRPSRPQDREKAAYLFVYGTLRASSPNPMSAALGREADRLGIASMPGLLYDVGDHPAAVHRPGRSLVRGEVYRLRSPAEILRLLDRYEGAHERASRREFRRARKRVRLASGKRLTAWVYLYDGPIRGLPVIASGDYIPGRRARPRRASRVS